MNTVPLMRPTAPKEHFLGDKKPPLEILMKLGISRTKALNALAATGGRSAKEATSWLVSHYDDKRLNDIQLRDYALIAVPLGDKFDKLHNFFEVSRKFSCWNLANNYLPHIMLEPFFQVRSQCEQYLMGGFSKLKEKVVHCENILFELFDDSETKRSYIVRTPYLKVISETFFSGIEQTENRSFNSCLRIGRNNEVYAPSTASKEKDLELLIIAGEVPPEKYTEMVWSALPLNMEGANEWEVRLYSRHPAVKDKQIYRTKQYFEANQYDEMDTDVGDYLIVDLPFSDSDPEDDWLMCVNLTNSKSGYVPINHIERVPESDCWSLHGSIVTHSPDGEKARIERALKPISPPEHNRWLDSAVQKTIESLSKFTTWTPALGLESYDYTDQPEHQSLLIMCHGESVESVFPKWTETCLVPNGCEAGFAYTRSDLNFPKELQARTGEDPVYLWKRDCPLTNIGLEQARLTGKEFLKRKVKIHTVFCSPAYRCLQTARAVLMAMGIEQTTSITIEPALFDYFGNYPRLPAFLNLEDLTSNHFNMDLNYWPRITVRELALQFKSDEEPKHFYKRNQLLSDLLDRRKQKNVLIVGHPLTLDTISQFYLKFKQPKTKAEMFNKNKQIPNCSVLYLEKRGKWDAYPPPMLPITHNFNYAFNWKTYKMNK